MSILNFSDTIFRLEPYFHFVTSQALSKKIYSELIEWCNHDEHDWLQKNSILSNHDYITFKDNEKTSLIEFFESSHSLFEPFFNVYFEPEVKLGLIKMKKGDEHRIHNDFIDNGGITHRVIIQLNSGWETHYGGETLIFSSEKETDLQYIYPPFSNLALGFKISQNSYHAVTKIKENNFTRYSFVLSFKEKNEP